MPDRCDLHYAPLVIDEIERSVGAPSSAVGGRERGLERLAYPARIGDERSSDELVHRRGHLLRQCASDGRHRRTGDPQAVWRVTVLDGVLVAAVSHQAEAGGRPASRMAVASSSPSRKSSVANARRPAAWAATRSGSDRTAMVSRSAS